MLIYLIRHGQTDWNAEGRLQGQQDIGLNKTGTAQAQRNGEKLRQLIDSDGFDFVSSPLTRTRQTMEQILNALDRSKQSYRTDERLVEICFGDWEGNTLPEVAQSDPEGIRARQADKWHFTPPGIKAESYESLSWRTGAWLRSVEKPTICVCHGGVIRTFFVLTGNASFHEAAYMDVPQDRILKLENGKMTWLDK